MLIAEVCFVNISGIAEVSVVEIVLNEALLALLLIPFYIILWFKLDLFPVIAKYARSMALGGAIIVEIDVFACEEADNCREGLITPDFLLVKVPRILACIATGAASSLGGISSNVGNMTKSISLWPLPCYCCDSGGWWLGIISITLLPDALKLDCKDFLITIESKLELRFILALDGVWFSFVAIKDEEGC